jgi:hypothetical protein
MGFLYYRHCPTDISSSLDWHVLDDTGDSIFGCRTKEEAEQKCRDHNNALFARMGLVVVHKEILERLEDHARMLDQYADDAHDARMWGGPTTTIQHPVTPDVARAISRDISDLKVK